MGSEKLKSDIEIAQSIALKPITKVAEKLNLQADQLQQYGSFKAKLPLNLIDEEKLK